MDFKNFQKIIQTLEKEPLLGSKAQFKLAPKMREPFTKEILEKSNPKKAAVLAIFYPNAQNETQFLLTKRASYKGVHSAQISFPGGKFDVSDKSLLNTALRETWEEVGIEKKEIAVFKEISDVYIPPSNFLVTPFLGFINQRPHFKINNEVEHVLEIQLSEFLSDNSLSSTIINTSYATKMEVPCFKLNNNIVWGATAMMLSEIKDLIKSI